MSTFYASYPASSSGGGGNPAAGPTGSPVPTDADYIGFSVGGTLTGVSAATPLPVTIESEVGTLNVNLTEVGGSAVALGQTTMSASIPVAIASNQSAIPASQSGTWSVTAVQPTGSNLHVDVDNFPATQPVSGTVTANQGTANTLANAWPEKLTDGTNGPVAVKAASTAAVASDPSLVTAFSPNSPLPSGTNSIGTVVATQTTAANLNATVTGTVTANAGTGNFTVVQPTGSNLHVDVDNTIATSSPVNANGTFTGSLSVTTSEGSTAAPANAVGVVFEAESGNATNIRWGISNSASSILSTSSGVLMEPGRSVDYLPIGFGTYLHYISVAAGSNTIDIQWVKSS